MPGGAEPKAKKRRKGGDRRDKEKPLLSVQVLVLLLVPDPFLAVFRIHSTRSLPDPDRIYLYGSRYCHHQPKRLRKTLISVVLLLL
jgi:hypothetical protein